MVYRVGAFHFGAFRLGIDYIPDWFMNAVTAKTATLHGTFCVSDHVDDTSADIKTLTNGIQHADYGDYIVQGIIGDIYPLKPDAFERMNAEVVGA